MCLFFFFQAEDGIRDVAVTGVQTCALPIWAGSDVGIRAVAITAVFALSAVNYYGVALGSGLQAALTIGKVLAIVAIIVVGFWLGAGLPSHFVAASGGGGEPRGVAAAGSAGASGSRGGVLVDDTNL